MFILKFELYNLDYCDYNKMEFNLIEFFGGVGTFTMSL